MFTCSLGDGAELRLPVESDAEELSALVNENSDYLRKWLPWVDATKTADDTKVFIKQSRKRFADNNGYDGLIFLENKLVGVIGYHQIDWPSKKTALGYWISENAQGKGLVTRAVRAFLDYGFDSLELNRIEIRCAGSNKSSRAIPERLGFTHEAICRDGEKLHDRFEDSLVFGMLAEEWKEKRKIEL